MRNADKKIIVVIPARMASTRLANKPMLDILGIPMIEHVYRRSKLSSLASDVVVATCDKEIFDHIQAIGGKAVMTKDIYDRSTDRIKECVETLERDGDEIDIVVNVGGDEPMIFPEMIDAVINPLLLDQELVTSNLIAEIKSENEFNDHNVVKCVFDCNEYAMYFSREPIPSVIKASGEVKKYKQLSVITFTRDFLFVYSGLPQTPCERAESVDMMRVLEHGYKTKVVKTEYQTFSVDTQEDYALVKGLLEDDPLLQEYMLPKK